MALLVFSVGSFPFYPHIQIFECVYIEGDYIYVQEEGAGEGGAAGGPSTSKKVEPN